MAERQISFAINRRDDSKHLIGLPVQGFAVRYPDRPQGATFFADMVTDVPWDVGELAFSHYLIARDLGVPIVALPAFQLRFLPHYGLLVHRSAGISTPRDLVGKRVGAPDWGFNPAVWLRGILAHQYDVPLEKIIWHESASRPLFPGLNYPHSQRYAFQEVHPPEAVRLSQKDAYGMPLLLDRHEVDALMMAGFGAGTMNSRRLFEDPLEEARKYVVETGVIPINTVFVVKEEAADRYPDLAPAILRMLDVASTSYEREIDAGESENHGYVPVRFARDLDMYPFKQGLQHNLRAVQMMIAYCYEQGMIRRLYSPEEIFLGSCL